MTPAKNKVVAKAAKKEERLFLFLLMGEKIQYAINPCMRTVLV
jgi:hypothetical protein